MTYAVGTQDCVSLHMNKNVRYSHVSDRRHSGGGRFCPHQWTRIKI